MQVYLSQLVRLSCFYGRRSAYLKVSVISITEAQFPHGCLGLLLVRLLGARKPTSSAIKTAPRALPWPGKLRIRLPVQEAQVPSLVQEDPTRQGPTKPVHHDS